MQINSKKILEEYFESEKKALMEFFKFSDAFKGMQNEFLRLLQPVIDPFAKAAEIWLDTIQKAKINEEEALKILRKYKWFITADMPLAFVSAVIKLIDDNKRHDKEINSLFINYFTSNGWENTKSMLIRWQNNVLFKKRYKIMKDCINTAILIEDKINYSNVILPTLISQIDGIISDYLRSKGIKWEIEGFDQPRKNNKPRKGRKSQLIKNWATEYPCAFDEVALNILINILFQTSRTGKSLKKPFYFNRHKILHGENVHYGKRNYVVRALLLLDFLSNLK